MLIARNDGKDRIVARNNNLTSKQIGNVEKHNERKKDSYVNPDIVNERSYLNYHYKYPSDDYESVFNSMVESGEISTRGLKPDAKTFTITAGMNLQSGFMLLHTEPP